MKTLELDLKKKVLIIDGNNCAYISDTSLVILGGVIYNIPEDYEFLCKGSELTEEIASELVYEISYNQYKNYKGLLCFNSAVESFISAVESKGFYWLENPIEKPVNFDLWRKYGDYTQYGKILTENSLKWQEAEEKTFRNPLIFMKK